MMCFLDGQYPRCIGYLRTSIIGMNPKSQVYKALVTCIEDEKLVKQALSPGMYPRVIIKRLVQGMKFPDGIYQGECDPTTKNYVYVATRVAEGYELDKTVGPQGFESVLLHEVVHWGRFIGEKPGEIDGKEAGNWFEHLAYNVPYSYHRDIPCPVYY